MVDISNSNVGLGSCVLVVDVSNSNVGLGSCVLVVDISNSCFISFMTASFKKLLRVNP